MFELINVASVIWAPILTIGFKLDNGSWKITITSEGNVRTIKVGETLQLKAGFVLEEFGENTIKISGVPEICINLDTKEVFKSQRMAGIKHKIN